MPRINNPTDIPANIILSFNGTDNLLNFVEQEIQQPIRIERNKVIGEDESEKLCFKIKFRNSDLLISIYSGNIYLSENNQWIKPPQFDFLSSRKIRKEEDAFEIVGEFIYIEDLNGDELISRDSYRFIINGFEHSPEYLSEVIFKDLPSIKF